MELGHLLTRSGLTYTEVSSKVRHNSFCRLENNVTINILRSVSLTFCILKVTISFIISVNWCDLFLSETMCVPLYLDIGGICSHDPVLSLNGGCCANTLIIKNCIYYCNKFHLKPFHFYLILSNTCIYELLQYWNKRNSSVSKISFF
jgi:hypothetical protein